MITVLCSRLRALAAAALGAAALVASPVAVADSISPTSLSADLGVGDSITVRKTVTVSAGGPTTALIDVMFVFDITGSMGGAIDNAKTAANSILTGLSGLGNVASGTGWYADPTFDGVKTDLTTAGATTVASINSLDACNSGAGFDGSLCGGDSPEKTYAAIVDAATTASWRTGSNRFIVVLGDAANKAPPDATATIAALTAANVDVIGLNFGSGTSFSSSITTIGGSVFAGGTSPTTVRDAILAGVVSSFASYSTVTVDDLNAGLPQIDVTAACVGADIGSCSGASAIGLFDRSIDRTFTFDVTFTRIAAGDTAFDTYALVNGGIVATERDTFGAGGSVPEPGTLSLLALSLLGLGAVSRRSR